MWSAPPPFALADKSHLVIQANSKNFHAELLIKMRTKTNLPSFVQQEPRISSGNCTIVFVPDRKLLVSSKREKCLILARPLGMRPVVQYIEREMGKKLPAPRYTTTKI